MAGVGKITYTTSSVDVERFHRLFDEGLAEIRREAGGEHPFYIDDQPIPARRNAIVIRSPIDTSLVLGRFGAAAPEHVDLAVASSRRAQVEWGAAPWRERVAILGRAASLLRDRKFRLAALMSLEVGKNRMEAMGDVEEAADLIDYYCQSMADADGFVKPMANLTPGERNVDVLRPFGVFACISPFNFPLALSTGMSSAALVAGNAVVHKPSEEVLWTGLELHRAYRDAGVPAGVFNTLTGRAQDIGDLLWQHPRVDGVVFTGSKAVGLRIHRGLATTFVKPCLMELGGKNATIVMPSADLEAAAEGVMRSAFGLQNQKCSATSRVYVHQEVRDRFLELLVEKTRGIAIGDPTERDVYFGPVINERALNRYLDIVAEARRVGSVLIGGERLRGGALDRGWYAAPTVAVAPLESRLFFEEFFVPFVVVGAVDSLTQALNETNLADYGLTAGLFSREQAEIDRFFDEVQAGVCYVNKRTGATTGAWPGSQPFCGWKGSGSTGKGGCGPYYVQQFMREQSRTVIVPTS